MPDLPRDAPDIPPDSGSRAHVLKSGEVRGSGMGAGGGNPGEDLDNDPGGGDAIIPTGAPDTAVRAPGQGADDSSAGLRTPGE